MLDIIKKSIYLGLGAATITKERVEKLADELIEKGQLSKEEKAKTVKDIMNKIEKEEKEIQKKVKKAVDETLETVGIATKKDIEQLKKRVTKLEKS